MGRLDTDQISSTQQKLNYISLETDDVSSFLLVQAKCRLE